jgi:osmotically-inducible protein OsmY
VAPDDVALASAVWQALVRNPFVRHDRVHVAVERAIVTLTGTATCHAEAEDAARAARHVPGVGGVVNWIDVPPLPAASDVARAIADALASEAAREARAIQVSVVDGNVLLRGEVHSWAERDAVLRAARRIAGGRAIEAQLDVSAPPPP